MDKSDKKFLGKRISVLIPQFISAGEFIILPPTLHLFKVVLFDNTSRKDYFRVVAVIIPLFVPTQYISLLFSIDVRTLSGRDGWIFTEPDLTEELANSIKLKALPFLESVRTLSDFIKMTGRHNQNNPHVLVATAYSLILNGNFEEGSKFLDELISKLDLTSDWQRDIDTQARLLRDKLETDPALAIEQLHLWERETIKNLKLSPLIDAQGL